MKKSTIIVAIALTLCMSSVTLTSCSEKETEENVIVPSVSSTDEKELETKGKVVTEKENKEETQSTTESAYAPTYEIKNASFESGLIQIGNDIFHQNGYYTVNQFVEKYRDKYDFEKATIHYEAFDPNEIYEHDNNCLFRMIPKNDSKLYIYVKIEPLDKNETTSVGDCIVMQISSPEKDCVWYPQYQEDLNITDTEAFLDSLGYKKIENNPVDELEYDCYWHLEKTSFREEEYLLYVKSNDQNLFGEYPILIYKYSPDAKTGKVILSLEDYFPLGTENWKSAKEGE